eukprot:GHVN01066580.1.p1 GENE.GHVN01066580.1~~GHVN01066580.1.p1  ORF type:complete len:1153 (-),score=154.31 GHVN01066580.1:7841-11299(-)
MTRERQLQILDLTFDHLSEPEVTMLTSVAICRAIGEAPVSRSVMESMLVADENHASMPKRIRDHPDYVDKGRWAIRLASMNDEEVLSLYREVAKKVGDPPRMEPDQQSSQTTGTEGETTSTAKNYNPWIEKSDAVLQRHDGSKVKLADWSRFELEESMMELYEKHHLKVIEVLNRIVPEIQSDPLLAVTARKQRSGQLRSSLIDDSELCDPTKAFSHMTNEQLKLAVSQVMDRIESPQPTTKERGQPVVLNREQTEELLVTEIMKQELHLEAGLKDVYDVRHFVKGMTAKELEQFLLQAVDAGELKSRRGAKSRMTRLGDGQIAFYPDEATMTSAVNDTYVLPKGQKPLLEDDVIENLPESSSNKADASDPTDKIDEMDETGRDETPKKPDSMRSNLGDETNDGVHWTGGNKFTPRDEPRMVAAADVMQQKNHSSTLCDEGTLLAAVGGPNENIPLAERQVVDQPSQMDGLKNMPGRPRGHTAVPSNNTKGLSLLDWEDTGDHRFEDYDDDDEVVPSTSIHPNVRTSHRFDIAPWREKLLEYQSLGLHGDVVRGGLEAIKSTMGNNPVSPSEVQVRGIPEILKGRNTLLAAETGSGKSLAFLLPLIELLKREEMSDSFVRRLRRPRAVILAPTRELAHQLLGTVKSISHHAKIAAMGMISGVPYAQQVRALQRGCIDIVVGTPKRVIGHWRKNEIALSRVTHIVIDEVDNMLTEGFDEEIKRVFDALTTRGIDSAERHPNSKEKTKSTNKLIRIHKRRCLLASVESDVVAAQRAANSISKPPQCIFATATMTSKTKGLVSKMAPQCVFVETRGLHKLVPTATIHNVLTKGRDKVDLLIEALVTYCGAAHDTPTKRGYVKRSPRQKKLKIARSKTDPKRNRQTLVFCNTVQSASAIHRALLDRRFSCLSCHGNIPSVERRDNLERFKARDAQVLICTDVASRGLDLPQIDNVVLFDFPKDPKEYLHRAGRCGRMGHSGQVVALVTKRELALATAIKRATKLGMGLEALTNKRSDYEKGGRLEFLSQSGGYFDTLKRLNKDDRMRMLERKARKNTRHGRAGPRSPDWHKSRAKAKKLSKKHKKEDIDSALSTRQRKFKAKPRVKLLVAKWKHRETVRRKTSAPTVRNAHTSTSPTPRKVRLTKMATKKQGIWKN